jgi:hypothetical protein
VTNPTPVIVLTVAIVAPRGESLALNISGRAAARVGIAAAARNIADSTTALRVSETPLCGAR